MMVLHPRVKHVQPMAPPLVRRCLGVEDTMGCLIIRYLETCETEGTFSTIPIRMVDRGKMNVLVKKVGSHDVKTLGLTQSVLKTKTLRVTSTSKVTKLEAAAEVLASRADVYSSLDGGARPPMPRIRLNPVSRVTETTVSKSKNIKCISVLQGLPRTQLCSVIGTLQ
jgi:hypothetical protein